VWAGERYFEAAGPAAEVVIERLPKVRQSSKRRSESVWGEEEGSELNGGRRRVELIVLTRVCDRCPLTIFEPSAENAAYELLNRNALLPTEFQ
jgi:hypothetical protein